MRIYGSIFKFGVMSLLLASFSLQAQLLKLSDLPLNVQSEIPPNLIVTLDDSGSMAWGFMPDSAQFGWPESYYRSSRYNRIYYDPTVTYTPPSKSTGESEPDAVFTAAIRGFYFGAGNQQVVDLSNSFSAVYFHYSTGNIILLDDTYVGFCPLLCPVQPAYYFQFNDDIAVNPACVGTDDQKLINNACYNQVVITDAANYPGGNNAQGRTLAEEQTNFANWYQYYAIRADASKSALQRAFVPESVAASVRVGRQGLTTDTSITSGTPDQDNPTIAEFDSTERAGFYSWVTSVPTLGNTPLRNSVYRAGEYFKTDNAYFTNPETSSGALVGCRVNSHILVTDGFYNGGFTTPTSFALDQTALTLPDGEAYSPTASPIFSNANDNQSIADLAFHYWATDLRAEDDNITPFESRDAAVDPNDYFDPRNDPATWQHMNSFAISFGAQGTISTDDATFQQLLDGTVTWPQSVANQATTIDDLYHSGMNGRGGYYNASNPDELVNALEEITNRLGSQGDNAPSVGATSGRISSDSNIFVASFDTDSWSGDLESFTISDGSNDGASCNTKPLGAVCSDTPVWSALTRNDEKDPHVQPGVRTVFTYNPDITDVDARGILFEWNGSSTPLNTTQQAHLNQSDTLGEERLNYILGDDSNEADNGGTFRTRLPIDGAQVSRVGAIVHSNPSYVGPAGVELPFRFPDDLEAGPYAISGRDAMVYVGANDGMLHGYNAETGQEVFAYVPNAVIENLHELTDPNFSIGAYVDGFIDVQDAYIDGNWRTLLASGLRSGGQGYFALDVTKPPSGTSIDPNDTVKWEFTDSEDADLGYTYGQPVIVKSNYNDGEWVVLLSNGYNSTEADGNVGTGDAVLYVLKADTGELIQKIPVGEADLVNPNGLSSPVAVSDSDIQHFDDEDTGTDPDVWTADYAYAGDLHGNLWKFDLSSTNKGQWKAIKMYSAGSEQPITSRPSVGSFPRRGTDANNQELRFVYFGTGQYVEPDDVATTAGQTFYAFIDDDTCTGSSACITSSDLVTQTINAQGVLSTNTVTNTDKGCRINLSTGGTSERIVNRSAVIGDNVIFSSLTPNGDVCDAGAEGLLYAINRFTCGATPGQILDTNNDGLVTEADSSTGGDPISKVDIKDGLPPQIFAGPANTIAIITPEGSQQVAVGGRTGRVRWRQIK